LLIIFTSQEFALENLGAKKQRRINSFAQIPHKLDSLVCGFAEFFWDYYDL
jgi:hypothetical protein